MVVVRSVEEGVCDRKLPAGKYCLSGGISPRKKSCQRTTGLHNPLQDPVPAVPNHTGRTHHAAAQNPWPV